MREEQFHAKFAKAAKRKFWGLSPKLYNLCKRIAVPVSRERADAWRAANDLFAAIGEKKHVPEPYTDPAASGGSLRPLISDPANTAILG